MKKLPPIQKILEAYTAIVDKHVNLTKDQAEVTSSNGAKTYTVNWDDNVYHSNDNATLARVCRLSCNCRFNATGEIAI